MPKPQPQVDPELQVEGLPDLTGKLDHAGRLRSEELAVIDGQSLRYALAEREQQLAQMIAKLQDRS
jgi:hypothetical protein